MEAISNSNAVKMMCDLFDILVECSRIEEDVSEGEDGTLEHRQHEEDLRRHAKKEQLDFEKVRGVEDDTTLLLPAPTRFLILQTPCRSW